MPRAPILLLVLAACGWGTDPGTSGGKKGAIPDPGGPDADGDKLSDADEARLGTDPNNPDSDGDGKKDGYEVHVYGTNPLNGDSDGDGVGDGAEISTYKTDPLVPDHEPEPPPEEPAPAPEPTPRPPQRHAGAGAPEPPEELRCGEGRGQLDCFVKIEGGTFLRGAQAADPAKPGYDPDAQPDEGPVREITVPSFWIQRYELNASAFVRCVSSRWCSEDDVETDGGFSTYARARDHNVANEPITSITWEGARKACDWLGARLPTEAEWEYAARGPQGRRFPWGDRPGCGVSEAVQSNTSGRALGRLKMLEPPCELLGVVVPADLAGESPFGLFGMAGNVWEWVEDWYAADAYASAPAADPRGPASGERRVQRGGGWTSTEATELRSAARGSAPPEMKLNDVGVRCVWGMRE